MTCNFCDEMIFLGTRCGSSSATAESTESAVRTATSTLGASSRTASLDALLGLEERIRRKLAYAAATVGVEHEVIPGAVTSDVVFAETRAEIERLRR